MKLQLTHKQKFITETIVFNSVLSIVCSLVVGLISLILDFSYPGIVFHLLWMIGTHFFITRKDLQKYQPQQYYPATEAWNEWGREVRRNQPLRAREKELRDSQDKMVEVYMKLKQNNSFVDLEKFPELEDNPRLDHFRCPIMKSFYHVPVIASDGYTYERMTIVEWYIQNPTSPMTRQPLTNPAEYPVDYELLSKMRAVYNKYNSKITEDPGFRTQLEDKRTVISTIEPGIH